MDWSIVIPTFHRPQLLGAAIDSCYALLLPAGDRIEIIIVDNSSDGTAEAVCRSYEREDLKYIHEPKPGLASARNRGIDEARGDFLAFLDDDEQASTSWFLELGLAFKETGADVVFGAVEAVFETMPRANRSYIADFYTRDVGRPAFADVSDILNYVGTGNSAYRREVCFGRGTRFDPRFNHFGGEDIQLFRALKKQGCQFVWAPEAKVSEWISVERASLSCLRKRRRTQGEQRVDGLWCGRAEERFKVPIFMVGGIAQAAVHAFLYAAFMAIGRYERAAEHAVEIHGGLGKVFWIGAARRENYGTKPPQ